MLYAISKIDIVKVHVHKILIECMMSQDFN